MKMKVTVPARILLLAFIASLNLMAQTATKKASDASAANLHVVADIDQRLAKFRRVDMPFHDSSLSARERKMVGKLVDASQYLEEIYWRQMDPEGLSLYQSLVTTRDPKQDAVRQYIWINASRFDLLDEDKPFVGTEPMPPGRGFYPKNLTRAQVEQFVQKHPDKKDEIYSSTTLVRWSGSNLEGIPYHVAYRSFLEPAAKDLQDAAALSDDPAFAKFLHLRADALLSDDYFPSDLAWVDLKDPKFDIIFAPYETYDDTLMGVKATYGAAVLVRNEEESKKLAMFQKYVADIQDSLPLDPEDRPSKRGLQTPMEVVDAPFRAGDLTHGYQAVADNLPNDPRVHEQKGSKKLFFKNFMDARVSYIILPVAHEVMRPDQADNVSAEGYLLATIMHEICHGLGPAFARTANGKVSIRESIGTAYSGLEEAKADVVGMYSLKWLVDHDALPKERLEEYYASYVGGIFRTVRFGAAESHGQAEMMEFNFLLENGAIKRNTSGRYEVNFVRMPETIATLAKILLDIEATGDRQRAEAWFKKYDVMPDELVATLKTTSKVPVDLDPVFSFKETLR